MAPLAPGLQLGRYALTHRVGTGGMGEVWAAELRGPGGFRKPVALKVLRTGPGGPEEREALLTEARRGALLHHPNVVAVHALEEHDGEWVIAMELVRGASLTALLALGPLSGGALLELGVQACAGLHHIHTLKVAGEPVGLVHRDIKPANLLVDQSGLVKVADLGVATVAGAGPAAGTKGFMPMEQRRGHARPASDVFALGVTLVQCATRTRPMGARSSDLLTLDQLLQKPGFLVPLDALVPGLGDVLARCLWLDPDARWSSAEALGEALSCLRIRVSGGESLLDRLSRTCPELEVSRSRRSSSAVVDPSAPTLRQLEGHLPEARDAFVGRVAEVDDLLQRLRAGRRLISVLGPGGMGKTRLVLRAAARLRAEEGTPVWFFDLSEARTVEEICFSVARGLGVELEPSDPTTATDPLAQLGWALRAKGRALFVVDNLEQCVEHVAATVGRWSDTASDARFLCTSRVVLGLRSERMLSLGPLSIDEGVALFLDRAPVEVPDAHRGDVRALVEAVEAMPLAVELAAARLRLMPTRSLREGLSLAMLGGGARELPARHRSIETSLRWSWDLLDEVGRTAMAQLSVCEGGFDLLAAEAVLDLPPEAGWAVDVLQQLVDASLVRVDSSNARFSMLRVVRAFAAERLTQRRSVELRHGGWFAQHREDAPPFELDNIVVACRRAIARADGPVAAGCAVGAWTILRKTGPLQAGVELLEAALGCPGAAADRWLAVTNLGALAMVGRLQDGLSRSDGVLAEVRRRGDRYVEGVLLSTIGLLHHHSGEWERAGQLFEQARLLHRETGDLRGEHIALANLGAAHRERGEMDQARACMEAALEAHEQSGDVLRKAIVLSNLGALHQQLGNPDLARRCLEEALAVHRSLGDQRGEALVLGHLGILHLDLGRVSEAQTHLEISIAANRRVGSRWGEGMGLANLGDLLRHQGRLGEARRVTEQALAATREVGHRPNECIALCNLGDIARESGQAGEAALHYQAALDLARDIADHRMHGHLLGQQALLWVGDPPRALRLLDEAEPLVRGCGDAQVLLDFLGVAAEVRFEAKDERGARAALAEADTLTVEHAASRRILERVRAGLSGS